MTELEDLLLSEVHLLRTKLAELGTKPPDLPHGLIKDLYYYSFKDPEYLSQQQRILKQSIQKWDNIINGEGSDNGSVDCPLCHEYNRGGQSNNCSGCIVSEKTGRRFCVDTPYIKWCEAQKRLGKEIPYKADTDELKDLAIEELNYLKGLMV